MSNERRHWRLLREARRQEVFEQQQERERNLTMSSTQLAMYERMPDPLSAVKQLGRSIAVSQMFGTDSVEQGEVLALECLARGIPPLSLAEKYHIICGKLSMKADAMLAEFNRAGGKHLIISRTADLAEIELSKDGQTIRFSLSWAEAMGEPFVYEGKESAILAALSVGGAAVSKLTLKPKYRTPHSRKQMLWARVVSDAVRAILPGVNSGRYTQEEIEDFPENATAINGNGHAKVNGTTKAKTTTSTVDTTQVVDVEVIPADTTPAIEAPATATKEQRERIKTLYITLGVPLETQQKALTSRGVNSLHSLTIQQADEILAKLEGAAEAAAATASQQAETIAGEGSDNQPRAVGPCSDEQVTKIKALLAEYAQTDPGVVERLAAKLHAEGKARIANLSREDASRLEQALMMKRLGDFFDVSCQTFEPTAKN